MFSILPLLIGLKFSILILRTEGSIFIIKYENFIGMRSTSGRNFGYIYSLYMYSS